MNLKIKTLHEPSRFRQRYTWMRIRRTTLPPNTGSAPQPRMYSLLLPPRYPADRR